MTMTRSSDPLRGSVDLLVLKTLSLEPMHGWGISLRLQQLSDGEFEMNQGTLYPALQRLERLGLITSEWQTTDNNRRARVYELTPEGEQALAKERSGWTRFSATMELVLRSTS